MVTVLNEDPTRKDTIMKLLFVFAAILALSLAEDKREIKTEKKVEEFETKVSNVKHLNDDAVGKQKPSGRKQRYWPTQPVNNWVQNDNYWGNQRAAQEPISSTPAVPVLKNDVYYGENGSYKYEYEIGDGTHVAEEGYFTDPLQPESSLVKKGWYSFRGADGITYKVIYWADSSGYHAFGSHLPSVDSTPSNPPPQSSQNPPLVNPSTQHPSYNVPPATNPPSNPTQETLHDPPPPSIYFPQQTYNPPQQSYNPPQHSYNPPPQSYKPPQQTYNPPQQSYKPQESYNPPQQSYKPQGSYNPPQQSYKPQESYNPPQQSYKPQESYNPPQQSYKPQGSYNPPQQSYKPQESYNPPQQSYKPQESYNPPQQSYKPQESYNPPQQSYKPQESYNPPQQSYNPSEPIYYPPDQSYNPPKQNFYNPNLQYYQQQQQS